MAVTASEVVEALEFVVSLTAEGVAPTAELGFSENMAGFFTNNKIGMFPAGGFFTGFLLANGMEMGEFDVQYWPKWASQRHQLGVCGPWLYNGGANEDVAWDFAKFSTQREVMELLAFFSGTTRTTPVRRSMNNAERFPTRAGQLARLLRHGGRASRHRADSGAGVLGRVEQHLHALHQPGGEPGTVGADSARQHAARTGGNLRALRVRDSVRHAAG